jgi:MYXO-CTERM domain-containing protein
VTRHVRKATEQHRILAAAAALVLLTGTRAQASEDAVQARPATWDMSLDELQAIGLGQSQGDPVPVSAEAPRLNFDPQSPGPLTATRGVIFVNFDGAQLQSGWDDAKTNTTQISALAGSFAPYGQGSKRDAVMQAVRSDWAAYNVLVVDQRPASGEYTMNMTGPTNPYGGGVLGIAPLDCDDRQTHSNITYAFHSVNDPFSAAVTATTIGQEVAHSYGLEHVNEPGDIMNPYNAGGDASFIDRCIQIVSNQGIACGPQHQRHCGTSSSQNAHAELIELFGASTPDTTAPVVQIVAPQDGDEFEPGASFEIVVEATDDTGMERIQLFSNGDALQTDDAEPYGWNVDNIPEGTYELHVVARDLAGNEATSNVVTIFVGTDVPAETGSGGSDGDDSDSDDGDSEGPLGDTDGSLPPGFGDDDGDDRGCSCRTELGSGSVPGLVVLLALLGLGRSRRRTSAR